MMIMTPTDTAAMALRFKALGDPNRLRILAELADGERCVCDLMDALDAGQSLLSFHLRTLKDAGLVKDRRAGRWVHYSINPGTLSELEFLLTQIREAPSTGNRTIASVSPSNCCE